MKHFWSIAFAGLLALNACKKSPPQPIPVVIENEDSLSLIEIPAGFPAVPFPEDNAFNMARWKLGKKLFYDNILSEDNSINCGSCHKIELAFSDDVAFSKGVNDADGVRNAPTLANVAYLPYYLREGGVPSLEMQVLVPIQEHVEFNTNIVTIAARLNEIPEYVELSQAAYNRVPDPYVITRAISTFERTILSGNSPYDQFTFQNKTDALSEAQLRGKALFFSEKTNCSTCHSSFMFTDSRFANNGLYQEYTDLGRYRLTHDSADLALFKVPTLRNIALTSPYMHDGSFNTLTEVLNHYNSGGAGHFNQSELIKPLYLTESELSDLEAFLNSLTDQTLLSKDLLKKDEV